MANGKLYWPLKPKLHGMQELARWCCRDRISFGFYHTFKDEDLNGRIVRVARAVNIQQMEVAALRRYYSWVEYQSQHGFDCHSDGDD